MRRSYVVPMRWIVIYGYEVPGGALNPSFTKLPRPWSPWESSLSRKNPHGRVWNRTQDLMISSQKLWPLDHEAGLRGINSCLVIRLVTCYHHFGNTAASIIHFYLEVTGSTLLLKVRGSTCYVTWLHNLEGQNINLHIFFWNYKSY
jgi:hypothetical protein